MTSNLQWHPVSANFNDASSFMRNATDSLSRAGTVFGELRKSILDEEQRKIENDYKEKQFAEAIRQFGITSDRADRTLAETIRHNQADEDYKLKNLVETSRYHTASLAAQKAYHDAIIGVRNRNIDAKYGGRGSIREAYDNYLFGDATPSSKNEKGAVKPVSSPTSLYTPEEQALAKGMSGPELASFALNDLGSISLGSSRANNPLVGGGAFFSGLPTPDMSVGDMANINTLPMEERMDLLRRMTPEQQMDQDLIAARMSGANPFGAAPSIAPAPSSEAPVQAPVPNPIQASERETSWNPFAATPVHAATLPPQQAPVVYKASPIGDPTARDREISASASFTPMDLADIDRRNAPVPLLDQAKDFFTKARADAASATPAEVPWWRADTGGSNLRTAMDTRDAMVERETRKNSKPIAQAVNDIAQGGKPRAVMHGDMLLYETPMQQQIREQQEAEKRKTDNPSIMFNPNRYNFDYTDENEDYALENLHPRYQAAVRNYITDLFSASAMTPMGNGSENANRASVIAEKELQALKAMANLGDASKNYATGMIKSIIARRPELMAKGRQAIAYLNDYYDKRFGTTEGRISLDTHYRAEAGDNQAIKQEMEIVEKTKALGKAQMAKEQKVNQLLSNPAVVTKNYSKVDSQEQTFMKNAAQTYMDTHDFKNADDQAMHALAFAMTIDDLPVSTRWWGEKGIDSYLQLGSNKFSRYFGMADAEDIDPDGNGVFGETFRRNLQILRRERLSGKALTNRMLSFIGYDSKKDDKK